MRSGVAGRGVRDAHQAMLTGHSGVPPDHLAMVSGKLPFYTKLFDLRAAGDYPAWGLARGRVDGPASAQMPSLGAGWV